MVSGRRRSAYVAVGGAALALIALPGCGAAASAGDSKMSGQEVAVTAEKTIRKQPGAAKGTMSCGSLQSIKDDQTRCERTVVEDGKVIKIGVTVTVTRDGRPARVRVKADRAAHEFGLTGESVADDLAKQYAAKSGTEPDSVHCPYLQGTVGKTITCKLVVAEASSDIVVTVDRVDASNYATHFTFRAAP